MKKHSVLSRFILPVVAATFCLSQPAMAEEEDTPLYESMQVANKALKSLRTIEQGDWAAGAEAARTAAAGMLKGLNYLPVIFTEMPDGKEKTVATADYRRLMGLSYASLCELELAYLAEDQALVDAATSKIKEVKKEGHKKYEDG